MPIFGRWCSSPLMEGEYNLSGIAKCVTTGGPKLHEVDTGSSLFTSSLEFRPPSWREGTIYLE